MRCPACAAELRLAERVPETLYGRYVYVRCPKCGKEHVGAMPIDQEQEPRLMTARSAFREGKRDVAKKNSFDGGVAKICAGLGVFGTLIMSGALIVAGPMELGAAAVVLVGGLGTSGAVYGGWVLDNMIGAEKWLQTLPRVQLAFAAVPEGYRA